MAIAFVASVAAGTSNASTVTTGSVNMTGANLFVAVVGSLATGLPSAVSDSVNGSTGWTKHDEESGGVAVGCQIWSNDGVTGTNQTFTVTSSSGEPSVVVYGFSGADDPAFEAPSNNNSQAAASSIQPGSITPDEDNELVVTGVASFRDDGWTINGGFSTPVEVFAATQRTAISASYLIQTSPPAAANPTWTAVGGLSDAATLITNYQAAPGGAVRRFILTGH